MKTIVAALAVALCLSATTAVEAQPEQPIMLSQILGASLRTASERQPATASVEDLLVAENGRVEVILSAGGDGSAGSAGRILPWSDLAYDAVRNEFTLRTAGGSLAGFQAWDKAAGETQGTAGRLLASKLLEGLVKSPQGENRGEVKDVSIGRDGIIRQVFFTRDQQTASIPWAGVKVLPERSDVPATPGTEAVIVVDRKKL